MPRSGEHAHVPAGLGDEHLGRLAGEPGMLINSSRARRNGAIASSMRSSRRPMSAVWASMRSRNNRTMNAWCALNRPVSASVRAEILRRSVRLARSAITAGSLWPAIRASSIARPDTPVMSVATYTLTLGSRRLRAAFLATVLRARVPA